MTAVLCATFTRARGRPDRVVARRSDGTEVSWPFPTYGAGLPHDLVHLVVESAFGLRRGLWGRVDAGADPARINEEASRARDGFSGFGEDRRELLVAEGLCAVHWHDPGLDDDALCDAVAAACASFGVAPPANLTPARVALVREAIARLRVRLRSVAADEPIALSFHVDDPEAGLGELLG